MRGRNNVYADPFGDSQLIKSIATSQGVRAVAIYPPIEKSVYFKQGVEFEYCKEDHKLTNDFSDNELVFSQDLLDMLQHKYSDKAMKMSVFRLREMFKSQSSLSLFKDYRIRSQKILDSKLSTIIGALNAISVQPSLVRRLISQTTLNNNGFYKVWLNKNGEWTTYVVDDKFLAYKSYEGQTLFFNSSPSTPSNEVWHMILEKALIKQYRGYDSISHIPPNELNILRDLTGAKVVSKKINSLVPGMTITQKEVALINDFKAKIEKRLDQGYIVTLIPRTPSDTESELNYVQRSPSEKIGNGIYSGHSYAVVSIQEARSAQGTIETILKLRNPFFGQKWEGDWSQNSQKWTEAERSRLKQREDADGSNQFWISIEDVMENFSHWNTCKVQPTFYNAQRIRLPETNYACGIARISIPKNGKYTVSLNQKDEHEFVPNNYKYCPVSMCMGSLDGGSFKLVSSTQSKTLRNTTITKALPSGEYWLLYEKRTLEVNIESERVDFNRMQGWRDFTLSISGSSQASIKHIEGKEYSQVHDLVLTEGWRHFLISKNNGIKLLDFEANLQQGGSVKIHLEKLNVPDHVFALRNTSQNAITLDVEFEEFPGYIFIGEGGRLGRQQTFSIDAGAPAIFIIRSLMKSSKDEELDFNINSVSARYGKSIPQSISKAYTYLLGMRGETIGASDFGNEIGVFNTSGQRVFKPEATFQNKEKRVIERVQTRSHSMGIRRINGDTVQRSEAEQDKINRGLIPVQPTPRRYDDDARKLLDQPSRTVSYSQNLVSQPYTTPQIIAGDSLMKKNNTLDLKGANPQNIYNNFTSNETLKSKGSIELFYRSPESTDSMNVKAITSPKRFRFSATPVPSRAMRKESDYSQMNIAEIPLIQTKKVDSSYMPFQTPQPIRMDTLASLPQTPQPSNLAPMQRASTAPLVQNLGKSIIVNQDLLSLMISQNKGVDVSQQISTFPQQPLYNSPQLLQFTSPQQAQFTSPQRYQILAQQPQQQMWGSPGAPVYVRFVQQPPLFAPF